MQEKKQWGAAADGGLLAERACARTERSRVWDTLRLRQIELMGRDIDADFAASIQPFTSSIEVDEDGAT
jgi:hypothetical protein